MSKQVIEFVGVPSGDGELFCWDVDEATFLRLTGETPEFWHKSDLNPGLLRYYPPTPHPAAREPHRARIVFDGDEGDAKAVRTLTWERVDPA